MVRSLAFALVLLLSFSALPVQAATLTTPQIQALVSLLKTFGVDEPTVLAVQADLYGVPSLSVPTRTLSLGDTDASTGGQVSVLQRFLAVPVTGTFDIVTQQAVQVWQTSHGIVSSGTAESTGYGVVGPKTRAAMQKILAAASPSSAPTTPSSLAVPVALTPDTQTPPGVNPNSVNADYFKNYLDTYARQNGVSAQDLQIIDAAIEAQASSLSDYRALFFQNLSGQSTTTPTTGASSGSSGSSGGSAAGGIAAGIGAAALSQGLSSASSAAGPSCGVPGTPFGGKLLYPFFCACSGTWLVGIQPLPPSYPVLLTYMPGTQQCLSKNIPFTTELLGKYTPGAGVCLVPGTPCVTIANEGLILPGTGSAPL